MATPMCNTLPTLRWKCARFNSSLCQFECLFSLWPTSNLSINRMKSWWSFNPNRFLLHISGSYWLPQWTGCCWSGLFRKWSKFQCQPFSRLDWLLLATASLVIRSIWHHEWFAFAWNTQYLSYLTFQESSGVANKIQAFYPILGGFLNFPNFSDQREFLQPPQMLLPSICGGRTGKGGH